MYSFYKRCNLNFIISLVTYVTLGCAQKELNKLKLIYSPILFGFDEVVEKCISSLFMTSNLTNSITQMNKTAVKIGVFLVTMPADLTINFKLKKMY